MCALNTVYTLAAVYYVARSAVSVGTASADGQINVLCRFVGGSRRAGDGRDGFDDSEYALEIERKQQQSLRGESPSRLTFRLVL